MLTTLNLHLAGVALLLLCVLYLAMHLAFLWSGLSANNDAALEQQRVQLIAAQLAARPLRGLDKKLVASTRDADAFYQTRLPYADSQVAAEIGDLAHKAGVRWTHAQYGYFPVLSGKYALTQVSIDASVSGDYRPIVMFINSLERDKVFFVINGIDLSGQQSGQVNLRIRMTTYLRPPDDNELSVEMPAADKDAERPEAGNLSSGEQVAPDTGAAARRPGSQGPVLGSGNRRKGGSGFDRGLPGGQSTTSGGRP
ncbi:MAG: GspMb/PilO family protein [Acidobacteriaceae bacterium]